MTTLHIVSKPGQPMSLCGRSASVGDAILLIEDGVYELLSGSTIKGLSHDYAIYALAIDARARGVPVVKPVQAITYDRFVSLTVEHSRTMAWF